ncbi:hypothetical protein MYX75_00315 [Acidobacteria bacterium AH-259-A15]|nr:hypothetical protein [Acidobacteria bacterium AH-259-A15]
MGESAPFVPFIASMGVMSLIAILPVLIAGIGSRDAALLVLFQQFNFRPETAVEFSLLVLLLHVSSGIVGAIAWGFHFAGKPQSVA